MKIVFKELELPLSNKLNKQAVYAIKCIPTGRFYIGSSPNIKRRLNEHLSELSYGVKNKVWNLDYSNYGLNSFKFYLVTEITDKSILRLTERLFIDMFFDIKVDDERILYNTTRATHCYKIGDESHMWGIGENHPMYGRHHTEESKAQISKSCTGNYHTEETKEILRQKNLGKNNPNYGKHKIGDEAPFYGKHHTEDSKQKTRNSMLLVWKKRRGEV